MLNKISWIGFLEENFFPSGKPSTVSSEFVKKIFKKWQYGRGSGRQKTVENLMKMKTFSKEKCKAYIHDWVNTIKGIQWSRELSLAT